MRFSKQLIAVAVVASTLGLDAQGASADITLLSSSLKTFVSAGGFRVESVLTPSSLPFSAVDSVVEGGTSNTTTYDFSASGNTAAFQFDFDHVLAESPSQVESIGTDILFTVTNDVRYSVDGVYTLSGDGHIAQRVELQNWTAGTAMFLFAQRSLSTTDESFTLGLQEGDISNSRRGGSTSGTLRAGNTYSLSYVYGLQLLRGSSGGAATASGNLNFNMVPVSVGLTQDLIVNVIDLNLQNGIANNLDAKLDAVVGALDDLNENNDVAACNALQAVINAVAAQSGHHIPVEEALALIEETQQILALLGCSP